MNLKVPVIGILRGVELDFFQDLMVTAFSAGLQVIEVTMNTPEAEKIISTARPQVPEGHLLGMGTIRNVGEADRALTAGAMFLVTPNLDVAVIELGRSHGIPVIVGALSPTEVYSAMQAGADLIKIFPCRAMGGPRYIRDLLGPFNDAPLVPVGGVDQESIGEYLAAGAKAVGVGPALFGRQALVEENITAVEANIKAFLARCPKKNLPQ